MTAPLRVLHITRDLPPRVRGGISSAVAGMVRASAPEVESAVVSFDAWRPRRSGGSAAQQERGVPVLRVLGPPGLQDAGEFADSFRPHLLCVHHGMFWAFARDLKERLGCPAAFYLHVAQRAMREARGLAEPTASELGQGEALREADAVFLPSRSAAGALEDREGIVLPLGVEDRPLGPGPRERDRVLAMGRFDVLKGTADVLAALGPLLAARPEARVRLAGGLPDNPRGERRWLERWDAGPGEREALQHLGWLDGEALVEAWSRASVVWAASHAETFGLAVLEAQQQGCAVIATDIPPHRELVVHGETGWLVPCGDPPALAAAAARLLADPDAARGLGARARRVARTDALWSARIGAHVRAWSEIGG